MSKHSLNISTQSSAKKIARYIPTLLRRPSCTATSLKDIFDQPTTPLVTGKVLGTGAYATVRQGFRGSAGEVVAVKSYSSGCLAKERRCARLRQEIHVLKELEHPNIIQLLETRISGSGVSLVLEFFDGVPLSTWLRTKPKLHEREVQVVIRQLASAVACCHAHGVVHCDIKLENVLLNSRLQLKLVDFGLAKQGSHSFSGGTLLYIAPELLEQHSSAGPPADVWAMGVLVYALLTGCFPFTGRSERAVKASISKAQVQWPSSVSVAARRCVAGMLARDPSERLTAREVLAQEWINGI